MSQLKLLLKIFSDLKNQKVTGDCRACVIKLKSFRRRDDPFQFFLDLRLLNFKPNQNGIVCHRLPLLCEHRYLCHYAEIFAARSAFGLMSVTIWQKIDPPPLIRNGTPVYILQVEILYKAVPAYLAIRVIRKPGGACPWVLHLPWSPTVRRIIFPRGDPHDISGNRAHHCCTAVYIVPRALYHGKR